MKYETTTVAVIDDLEITLEYTPGRGATHWDPPEPPEVYESYHDYHGEDVHSLLEELDTLVSHMVQKDRIRHGVGDSNRPKPSLIEELEGKAGEHI